jgi:hypothetical protein
MLRLMTLFMLRLYADYRAMQGHTAPTIGRRLAQDVATAYGRPLAVVSTQPENGYDNPALGVGRLRRRGERAQGRA